MPDYDARERELQKSFEEMQARLQPVELVRCLPIVKTLLPERTASLAALSTLLRIDGFEPISGNYANLSEGVWGRFVTPLSSLLDGLTDVTVELDHWRELAATGETRFFRSLQDVKLAEARDEISALHTNLTEMIGVLQRKWVTMSDESQRLEQVEQRAAAEMTAIVTQTLHEETAAWARYGEALQRLLERCMKVPDLVNDAIVYLAVEFGVPDSVAKLIPKVSMVGKDPFALAKDFGIPAGDFAKAEPWLQRDPGMAVSETIQKAIGPEFEAFITAINALYKNVLPIASGAYGEQVVALRRQLPNHGSILVSLSQTRHDVDDFLQKSGMDRLRSIYDRTTHELDQWAGSTSTDGQKSDAGQFNRNVREAFSRRFEQMTHEFEEFVRANTGRFIGTVDHATEEGLLWTEIWVDRAEGIAHLGMDDRLKEWRSGTMEVRGTFDTASLQLFEKLRYLSPDLHDKIAGALNAYWDKLRAQLRREAEQAAQAMATAETRVTDDQIKKDLDRSELKSRLNA